MWYLWRGYNEIEYYFAFLSCHRKCSCYDRVTLLLRLSDFSGSRPDLGGGCTNFCVDFCSCTESSSSRGLRNVKCVWRTGRIKKFGKQKLYLFRCFVPIGTNCGEIRATTARNPCSTDTARRPVVPTGSTLGESSPCTRGPDVKIHRVRVLLQFARLYYEMLDCTGIVKTIVR